jgi:RNA polymerase sigma-70 factor (ECF subfamily)
MAAEKMHNITHRRLPNDSTARRAKMTGMGFVREVELDASFAPARACRDYFGYAPAVYRAQSLLPRLIEAEVALAAAILFDESALSHRQKERLLLVLAAAEGNGNSAITHYEMLRILGEPEDRIDRILNGYVYADLPSADVELLDFALKLCSNGSSVSRADIDGLKRRGCTDEVVLETVLLTAWAKLESCVAAGAGAAPDFPPISIPQRGEFAPQVASAGPGIEAGPYLTAPPLDPDRFAPFAVLRERLGFIPNVFRAQSGRPNVIEAELDAIRLLLFAEEHLPKIQKEQILLVVSAANHNSYFVAVHSEILSALGVPPETADRIVLDHRHAGLDEGGVALLDFARKLAVEPSAIAIEDWTELRTHGCSDEQILEAVATTGLTNFLNTVQFGIGAVPDFDPRIALPMAPAKIANLLPQRDRPTSGSLPIDPDAEAVARVQNGEPDAFEVLVARHSRRVYRTLLGILGSDEEARDAMQDTFVKAFQHLGEFQGRSKFSTWLVSIASNTGLQQLRERKPTQSLDEDFSEADESFRPRQIRAWTEDPEQLYSRTETRALVEEGVMKLPAKYRVVLMLRDIEQLSIEEAAAALGLGIPALKSRHLRGRLMLREALTPHFAANAKGEMA